MPKNSYWLTTADMAKVYGVATSTIYARMLKDEGRHDENRELPREERLLGRSRVWDRNAVKRHMLERSLRIPEFFTTLGLQKPIVEEGDELLDIDDVMSIFDYSSRPEFQHRVREGAIPPPDYRYERPFPSFWLKSSVEKWIEGRKSTLSYRRLAPGHYQVSYGAKAVGEVEKVILRVDSAREADNSLVEKPIYRWQASGVEVLWETRKKAAMALVDQATDRADSAATLKDSGDRSRD